MAELVRNTRTSTPKVRTGCITCKKRRIKCDETKPSCWNCDKSSRTCEGYVIVPRKKREVRVKGQPGRSPSQIASTPSPIMQLVLDLDAVDFANAQAQVYFREFVYLVQQPWLSSAAHSDLWDVTLPQLTRNNGTLRHAATAIGALSVWHRQSGHKMLASLTLPDVPNTAVDAHYFHALAYYNRSLKLGGEHYTIQDALFLSFLLVLFETIRDNRTAALEHVNHGLALLVDMLVDEESENHIDKLAPNPRPLLSSIAGVFTHLSTQARSILRGRIGSSGPLPNFTRGLRARQQTLESFTSLINNLDPKTSILERIPAVFTTLDEVERFISAAQQRQRYLYGILSDTIQESPVLTSGDDDVINAFWVTFPDHPRIAEFSNETNRLANAMTEAMMPLFNSIILADSDPGLVAKALNLRLQCMELCIFDSPGSHIKLGLLQAQTPFFREYLSLIDLTMRAAQKGDENPACRVSLHSSLVGRLFNVTFACRDPLVREDALWKLRDYPGRDGLWDARTLYALGVRNRAVERGNMIEGTPQEQWRRLWRREFVFEDGGRRITFRYLEKNKDTGKWELVEETADLNGVPDDVHWVRQPISFHGKLFMGELVLYEEPPPTT